MNIVVQCCGLVLLMVIFCFYMSQKKIQLHTGQAFMGIWTVTTISLMLDILSMILLYYRQSLPATLVRIGCKTYISSLIWVAIFCVIYICADIYENRKQFLMYRKCFLFSGIVFTFIIFMLPIYMHVENAYDTYTYGPATIFTYIFAALTLMLLAYLIVAHSNVINPNRRRAVWLWLLVWVVAAMVQFINNSILLVGFASAIGVMIIYLKLENPEANLHRETGLFNESAFLLYMKQLINQNKEYNMLVLSYQVGASENLLAQVETSIHMEIGQFLQRIPDTTAFRLSEGRLVMVFLSRTAMDDAYHLLRVRFAHPWGTNQVRLITPKWFYLAEPCLVDRAEDYLDLFQYASHIDQEFVAIDSAMVEKLYGEQEVENMILRAMNEDRVEVFYQPIFSTQRNKFTSAEALVRIRNEEGKIVPPGMFIEVAERTGLIVRLGEIVFEKVCKFIKEYDITRYGLEYIEVNLSIIQCGNEQMAESFIKIMRDMEVPSSYINLEITETASMNEKRILLQNMEELREFGVSFSLDDFGTGQSNLNYIVDMPVDIVKFDRNMTQAYFDNRKARYVMDATMHMIHGLKLHIVAEGVETKEQFQTLAGMGISYIQGYYFSKPLSKNDFIKFLAKEVSI